MKRRFQIITVYKDCSSKTETVSYIQGALAAASIYWTDPDCISVTIYDWSTREDVLNYTKPE